MPALIPTSFEGRVVWLGRVADREARLASEALERADLDWAGIDGEAHGGATRGACARVRAQHPKGTEIRNVRQLSVLSAEELAAIASDMGIDALDPALVGASMVLEGIPDFTHLPPSSRLQATSGATLVIDMENRPCVLPAKEIDAVHKGIGKAFKLAAKGRRGVTAWVERTGTIALGDVLRLHVPDQPVWAHLESARRVE